MPALVELREEANRRWRDLAIKANYNDTKVSHAIIRAVLKNPLPEDPYGPAVRNLVSNGASLSGSADDDKWPEHMVDRLDPRPTDEQAKLFYEYFIKILQKAPVHFSTAPVAMGLSSLKAMTKDEVTRDLASKFLTDEPPAVVSARHGRERLAMGIGMKPDDRRLGNPDRAVLPFSRARPGVDEAPVRPSGMGERSNAAAVTADWMALPRAGPAPQGGRKKTTRLPSRSSRRRRSTRSRRNRGGAKSL